MLITRKSSLSGITRSLELNVTQEQLDRHTNGEHAQKVFSNLPAHEREFIMTGITKEEWDNAFPDDDDEKTLKY